MAGGHGGGVRSLVIQFVDFFILFIYCGDQKLIISMAFHWLDFCFLFRLYPVCSQFNIVFKKSFDCIAI